MTKPPPVRAVIVDAGGGFRECRVDELAALAHHLGEGERLFVLPDDQTDARAHLMARGLKIR